MILGSFNDDVSIAGLYTTEEDIVYVCGSRQYWLFQDTLLAFAWSN
jgi:hypothetical protein